MFSGCFSVGGFVSRDLPPLGFFFLYLSSSTRGSVFVLE